MTLFRTLSIGSLAAAALAFTAMTSQAQRAPDTPAKAPAAAAKTKAPAKKATKAATSACQGLAEAACKSKSSDCRWIGAVKRKDGKQVSAYCRSVPKAKAKTTAAKKTTTAPKRTAPKAKASPPPAATK